VDDQGERRERDDSDRGSARDSPSRPAPPAGTAAGSRGPTRATTSYEIVWSVAPRGDDAALARYAVESGRAKGAHQAGTGPGEDHLTVPPLELKGGALQQSDDGNGGGVGGPADDRDQDRPGQWSVAGRAARRRSASAKKLSSS
jgi:hypothetical protein